MFKREISTTLVGWKTDRRNLCLRGLGGGLWGDGVGGWEVGGSQGYSNVMRSCDLGVRCGRRGLEFEQRTDME